MNLSAVSKAVAGALAGAAAGGITGPLVIDAAIPADVQAPWWGYLLAAALNAAIGFAVVYLAPRNRGPGSAGG